MEVISTVGMTNYTKRKKNRLIKETADNKTTLKW
jgi:hypothetical protein